MTLGLPADWNTVGNTDGERYITPQRLMNKFEKDKERMDEITEVIADQKPIKEWACLYWMAVAIGHILEWIVKHGKEFRNS